MYRDNLREAIDTYNELLRLHQLNWELLETLELSLFWLQDFSKKNNIPIPNREKFAHLLSKIHALVTEISSQPNLLISDETLQGHESDEDLTEPDLNEHIEFTFSAYLFLVSLETLSFKFIVKICLQNS